MKCEDIQAQLPNFWSGEITSAERLNVEAHMAVCPSCKAESDFWSKLALIPDEQPAPELSARFQATLAAYRQGLEAAGGAEQKPAAGLPGWLLAWWPRTPVWQFALAVMCLVGGAVIGSNWTASSARTGEMARLHQELRDTREMVAVSLLQQQSASDRLRGVSWSARLSNPDDEVLRALLFALKNDQSVDVRLAAADALRRYARQPAVRQGLIDSFGGGQSPLVQIALIDALADARDRQSEDVLKRITTDRSLNEAVRQRADRAVSQY